LFTRFAYSSLSVVQRFTRDQQRRAQEANDKALGFFNRGNRAVSPRAASRKPRLPIRRRRRSQTGFSWKPGRTSPASHFRRSSNEKAIAAARKAEAINPQSVQMIKLISVAYSSWGTKGKAVEYQEKTQGLFRTRSFRPKSSTTWVSSKSQ